MGLRETLISDEIRIKASDNLTKTSEPGLNLEVAPSLGRGTDLHSPATSVCGDKLSQDGGMKLPASGTDSPWRSKPSIPKAGLGWYQTGNTEKPALVFGYQMTLGESDVFSGPGLPYLLNGNGRSKKKRLSS